MVVAVLALLAGALGVGTSVLAGPAGATAVSGPATGTVWGSVTTAAGAPIGGITATLHDPSGHTVASAASGPVAGWYAIPAVAPGTYTVSFTDPTSTWGPRWWPHALVREAAGVVRVTAGATTWAAVRLDRAGTLAGTIRFPGLSKFRYVGCAIDAPVCSSDLGYQLVLVDAAQPAVVRTVADLLAAASSFDMGFGASYSVTGLAAGDYRVLFIAMWGEPWSGLPVNRPVFASATATVPVPGTPVTNAAIMAAIASAPVVHLTAGSTTTVSPVLPVMACDPTTLYPGVGLAGATLTGLLGGCDLHDADLTGTTVSAQLAWVNLTGVSARGADFRAAQFGRTDLRGADLTGAQFSVQPASSPTPLMIFGATRCPDGTNSDDHLGTCLGYGIPVAPVGPAIG